MKKSTTRRWFEETELFRDRDQVAVHGKERRGERRKKRHEDHALGGDDRTVRPHKSS